MATDSTTVSVSTLKLHHGYYRWAIERESVYRFVRLWSRVGSSKPKKTTRSPYECSMGHSRHGALLFYLRLTSIGWLWRATKVCHLSWLSCPGHTVVSRWITHSVIPLAGLADVLCGTGLL